MAKVLEALIAKGRRVRRPREQKEVAFGLCDLSTHEELHERIVKKGGVVRRVPTFRFRAPSLVPA